MTKVGISELQKYLCKKVLEVKEGGGYFRENTVMIIISLKAVGM